MSSGRREPEAALSERPELAECNGRADQADREDCYSDVAFSASNAGLCDEITSENLRNLCLQKVAVKVGDVNICGKIRNDDWRYNNCLGGATL